jgi:hypothetical protein
MPAIVRIFFWPEALAIAIVEAMFRHTCERHSLGPSFQCPMNPSSCLIAVLVICLSAAWWSNAGEPKSAVGPEKSPSAEQVDFFEKKIRPVLVKHCYRCHSSEADKVKGGLLVDGREGLRKGGDTGPALTPGDPANSLLIRAIRHQTESLRMPKDEKLPDDVIADFEQWVKMGAPDPRAGTAAPLRLEIDIAKGRQFWSFQPPSRRPIPTVNKSDWPRSDIDRFLLAAMEAKGLTPAPDADGPALLRRAYFDLIGLPPSPSDVNEFLRDQSPQALAAVVNRLLASPRFGERWGRHWLDVARFAESSGKQSNQAYPHAWRYRDYVIAAFNADTPYDRFIREQLAGDLLPARDDAERAKQLVATGFLAIGPKAQNEGNRLRFDLDVADEQIDATTVAFLGMTVACARCHDHKFDPIPTRDYYALAGIFLSTETCYGTIRTIQSLQPSPLHELPNKAGVVAAIGPLAPAKRAELEKQLAFFKDRLEHPIPGEKLSMAKGSLFASCRNLESRLALYDADGAPRALAMGARERGAAVDSKLYVRGEIDQPGAVVPRGFPQVMTAKQPQIRSGSGRLELANWIASSDNPLTARVMANRVWLHLFGRGLVATPDHFGSSGQAPSNPALLDHLALRFIDNGWSVKKLIREIVLSRAYQQSAAASAKNYEVDPDNLLIGRMPKRRLEAEALHDALLAVSGNLDLTPPRGTPLAENGDGTVAITFRAHPIDRVVDTPHRAVYMPIVRDLLPEALTLFDFPDPSLIAGERATTTVPAQSLYLMNGAFVIRQAEAVAAKLLAGEGADLEMLRHAYLLCFSRPPSAQEQKSALEFLGRYESTLPTAKQTAAKLRHASWTALCQALFASNEFSYR